VSRDATVLDLTPKPGFSPTGPIGRCTLRLSPWDAGGALLRLLADPFSMQPMSSRPPVVAPSQVLRLHMEGVDELDGDVRLGSFIEKLAALRAALAETEHLLIDGAASSVDFRVSELSHNSPAMVGLTAFPTRAGGPEPSEVVGQFFSFLIGVRARTVEVPSSRAKLVGHLRKLVAGVGERFERIWIDGPNIDRIPLDAQIVQALEDALPDVRREIGAVKGIVKRYSGVGKQPYFKIVPPVGGVEIKCIFPTKLIEKAAAAVEHNATVQGELKSYEDDAWPYEVRVRAIVIHPSDADMASLLSLEGAGRDASEVSVAEFIRGLRNEW